MSRELQDRADNLIKELREALVPLSDEIKKLKRSEGTKESRF